MNWFFFCQKNQIRFFLIAFLVFISKGSFGQSIAQYDFSNNGNDASGYNNHATLFAPFGNDRFGQASSALSFNGADNYVYIANAPQIEFDVTTDISYSFWINNGTSATQALFAQFGGSQGIGGYLLDNGSLQFYASDGVNSASITSNGEGYNDGFWHHVVMLADRDAGLSIYVDGILDSQNSQTSLFDISEQYDMTLGYDIDLGLPLAGYFDDIKILDYAISLEEIQAEYNANGWPASGITQASIYLQATTNSSIDLVREGSLSDPNSWSKVVSISEPVFLSFFFNGDLTTYGDYEPDGIAEEGGGAIEVSPGIYYIQISAQDYSYQIHPIASVGLTGSARTGDDTGWNDPDTDFSDLGNGQYQLQNVALFNGEFKIRANDRWDHGNWGDDNSDNILEIGGANLTIEEGLYDLSFDAINSVLDISLSLVTISGFSPSTGSIGTSVTITGSNFSSIVDNNNRVYFGSIQAAISAATSTSLTVTVPSGSSYSNISVMTNGRLATSSLPFIVTFTGVTTGIDANSFAAKSDPTSTSTSSYGLTCSDFDGDGNDDLAVTNYSTSTVSVYRNTTTGIGQATYAEEVNFTTGLNPFGITYGDFNNDGKQDIATANYGTSTVSVFLNTSTAVGAIDFAAKMDLNVGSAPNAVTSADFDGDGWLDLAVANTSSNSASVLRNSSSDASTVSFTDKVDYPAGTFPYGIAHGDIDGDSKADLIVANGTSTTISVFRNISSGAGIINFDSRLDFTTGTNPFAVGVADLDNDSKLDVVVANASSSSVSLFLNTGASPGAINLAAKSDFATGASPRSLDLNDFDGDGLVDIVVGNYSGNSVSILRNTNTSSGTLSFATNVDFGTGTNPYSIVSGDFDLDGKPDLATANISAPAVSVIRNAIKSSTYSQYHLSGNADDANGGYNGTVSTGALFSTDRFGYGFSSFEPENNGTFIEIDHGGAWDLNSEVIVTAWIRPNSLPTGSEFWDVIFDGGGFGQMNVQTNGELLYHWLPSGTSTFLAARTRTGVISSKQWNHVTLRIDTQNELTLFVNGVSQEISLEGGSFVSSLSISRANGSSLICYIGNNSTASTDNRWFDGSIDDVRVYTGKSLTNQEIFDIYESEKPQDLRLNFEFASGALTSTNGYGYSGNYRNVGGTTITPVTTEDRFGDAQGAMLFQNTGNELHVVHERTLNLRNNVTVNMWVKPTALPATGSFGDVLLNDNAGGRLVIFPNGGLAYHYPADGGTSFPTLNTPVGMLSAEAWKMVSMSISEDNIVKIYVDGQLQPLTKEEVLYSGDISDYTGYGNPDRFILANADVAGADNRFFDGALDDFRFYQSVLTDEQIALIFEGVEVPAAPTGLTSRVVGPTAVELLWTDNATNETEYILKVFDGEYDQLGSDILLPANSLYYLVTELVSEELYHFEVTAINEVGFASATTYATPVQLPTPIVETFPAHFTLDETVTITYYPDRSYPKDDLYGQAPIYMHAGLVPVGNENGEWDISTVVGNWGLDDGVGRMSPNGDGSWSISFVPRSYFNNVSAEYVAAQLGMVFRSADGMRTGKGPNLTDLYVDVYQGASRPSTGFLSFDGIGSLSNTATDPGNESAWINRDQLTYEAWIHPEAVPSEDGFWSVINRSNTELSSVFDLYLFTTGGITYLVNEINDGTQQGQVYIEVSTTLVDKWSHVAGTYDGSVLRLYLNGALVASQSISMSLGTPYSNESLNVGANGFTGFIDEARLWGYARSQDQLRETILAPLLTPEDISGLVGYWPGDELFTDGSDFYTVDLTSNGNHLYVNGNVEVEKPDIAIVIESQPSSLVVGSLVSLGVSLTNPTETELEANDVPIKVYLSANETLDGVDELVLSDFIDLDIPANGLQNLDLEFSVPELADGLYQIIVTVDESNQVQETDEDNNMAIGSAINLSNILSAPAGLQALSVADKSFDLQWASVTGASGYEYQVSTMDNFSTTVVSTTTASTFVNVVGLSPNTTYHFRVRAVDSSTSRQSEYSTGSTNTISILEAPANLQTIDITTSTFTLSWSSVGSALGYSYQVATDANFASIVQANSITNTSASFNSLTHGTTYHFRVLAFDNLRQSEYTVGSTSTLSLLTAPLTVEGVDVSALGFTLQWTSVSQATEYFYQVASDNGFLTIISSNTISGTSVSISGLNISTTYHFRVRAQDPPTNRESDFTIGSVTTLSDTTIPTLTVSSPVAKSLPMTVTISIQASDNIGVSYVEFFKRGALDNEGSETSEVLPASGLQQTQNFEVDILANDFDNLGVSFYAISYDVAGNESAPSAIKTITRDIPAAETQTISGVETGSTVQDYQILALPYVSTPVSSVIGLDEDPEVWRLSTWNPSSSSYNYSISTFSPGVGYWLIINDPTKSSLNFNDVSPVAVDEVFTITLRSGWNQIGNPFLQTLNWPLVRQHNLDRGIITSTQFTQLYVYESGYTTRTSLSPYQGAFVEANGTVSLEIPLTALSANRISDDRAQPRQLITQNGGWELVLDFQMPDNLRYGISGFGQFPEADDQADHLDLNTPLLFDQFVKAEFIGDQNLARSIHRLKQNDTWTMAISSSYKQGTPIRMTVNGIPALQFGESLVMLDITTGAVTAIEGESTLELTYRRGMLVKFIKGEANFIEAEIFNSLVSVSNPYPNPSTGTFHLTINKPDMLSEISAISLKLIDLSGREVWKTERKLNSGYNELNFELESAQLMDGIYFVELMLGDRKITKKVYLKREE